MVDYVEELTKEQEARLPEYKDRFIELGLRCGKSNRELGNDAVDRVYDEAKLTRPKIKVWTRSPLEGALVASVFTEVNTKFLTKVLATATKKLGRNRTSALKNYATKEVMYSILEANINDLTDVRMDRIYEKNTFMVRPGDTSRMPKE